MTYRALIVISLILALNPVNGMAELLSLDSFSCQELMGGRVTAKIYRRTFKTEFRGQMVEIPYVMNQQKFSKRKDIFVVIPGLSMPAFEEMVMELGARGEQAISMDFTNINNFGGFEAPTLEEDAALQMALLKHLGLLKETFQAKTFIMDHSRGNGVLSRLAPYLGEFHQLAGVIGFNPYMGWISSYHARVHGKGVSSGFRIGQAMVQHIPGFNDYARMMADVVERISTQWAETSMNTYFNLHNQSQAHRRLSQLLNTDDELILENARQKLIGMEGTEVAEHLAAFVDAKIPLMFVVSEYDEWVPVGQVREVADSLGIPVIEIKDTDHYLPYKMTQEAGLITQIFLQNVRFNRPLLTGLTGK